MRQSISIKLILTSICLLMAAGINSSFADELQPIVDEEVQPIETILTDGEIDQLLAPIALYPDTLLSQILVASTYPVELIRAHRWLIKHPELSNEEINEQTRDKDWAPSIKALLPFPKILTKMSEDLDWTQDLGDAFLQDEKRLLKRIQVLRQQAYASGHLDESPQVKVIHEKETIYIEPAEPEVVYVPYYDPRIVYGSWRWNAYPPYYWDYPYYSYAGYYRPGFYWSPGIRIGWGFGFAFNWGLHSIVYINHPHRHRYYRSRSIVHSTYARTWRHNPHHRRGAVYRSRVLANRYHRPHSYRERQFSRNGNQQLRTSDQQRHSTRTPTGHHEPRSVSVSRQARIRAELAQNAARERHNVHRGSNTNPRRGGQFRSQNDREMSAHRRQQSQTIPENREQRNRSVIKERRQRVQPVIRQPRSEVEVRRYRSEQPAKETRGREPAERRNENRENRSEPGRNLHSRKSKERGDRRSSHHNYR